MSNTIKELIQPWLLRLLEQQLQLQVLEGALLQQLQQLQYLQVTLQPQLEPRLPQLVAQQPQQQLQSRVTVVPKQQVHWLRQLQVLPLLLLPLPILEHLQQRQQPPQQQLLQEHLLQPFLQ